MPLSILGESQIRVAATELGVGLKVLNADRLLADGPGDAGGFPPCTAHALIEIGASLHAPAAVVYEDDQFVGPALLGFKESGAYEALLGDRLTGHHERIRALGGSGVQPSTLSTCNPSLNHSFQPESGDASQPFTWRDVEVPGKPGAYFRYVAVQHAIAYESEGFVYLLTLHGGQILPAPGFVDFIPSPDGQFFVTPAERRGGLRFFEASDVFAAAKTAAGERVKPIFVDADMRDQYPSVGVLSVEETSHGIRRKLRVVTSWFDGAMLRDYVVTSGDGRSMVVPLGPPVVACKGEQVSLPILSRDGRELATRDGATGNTVIWRLDDNGACTLADDLGFATSKVAWSPDGHMIAFFRQLPESLGQHGIYTYDRDNRTVTRIGTGASTYAFPDFVGADSLVFLARGARSGRSTFRIVCCVRR